MRLDQYVEWVRSANNVDDLVACFSSCGSALGFPYYALQAVLSGRDRGHAFVGWAGMPDRYRELFCALPSADEIAPPDPVMTQLRESPLPVVWNGAYYERSGAGDVYGAMCDRGVGQGIALAVHLRGGRHILGGFMTGPGERFRREDIGHQIQSLQLLMSQVVDAAREVVFPAAMDAIRGENRGQLHVTKALGFEPPEPGLSAREREVLQWAAAGKTAWEISVIASVSERTVEKQLASAITKLGCGNRPQAVAVALRSGLIR